MSEKEVDVVLAVLQCLQQTAAGQLQVKVHKKRRTVVVCKYVVAT